MSVNRQFLEKIIEAGVQAPSGSNSQPWRFEVLDNVIRIFALPEKDHLVLNFRDRGTLIAIGALVENIVIAASNYGYNAEVNLLVENMRVSFLAEVKLKEGIAEKDPLFDFIFKRSTNRKPYKILPLSDIQKSELLGLIDIKEGIVFKLIEDRGKIEKIAENSSISEKVMFEDDNLRRLLLEEIVWTEKEERLKKSGLYLKTMELNPVQRFLLKRMRNQEAASIFLSLGFPGLVAKSNADLYKRCGAMGVISVRNKDADFFHAGRLLERIWLKATQLGFGFHIMTGIPFFWQRCSGGDVAYFSEKQISTINEAYKNICDSGNIPDNMIAGLVFRMGEGPEPSARSLRKKAEIKFL